MEWLLEVAKQYGPFTALVCYVIWDSRQREKRYLDTIDNLANKFNIVESIQGDVEEVRQDMKEIKNKMWRS